MSTADGGGPREASPRPGAPANVRELVLASAGSGKTFRISSRIIQLLASGEGPGAVFASTFTRKAAGEILERVLVRLAVGASSAEEAAELGRHVAVPEGATPDPAFWREVLGRTVRALHELDVGTLDSFFGRAVRSFGHDLGLPSGWGIADAPTADRLRAQALEEVLGQGDPGAMAELVRGLRGGEVRRSVHEQVLDEVDALDRVHRDRDEGAPGWDAAAGLAGEPVPDDLEERARAVADQLAGAELPTTNAGKPRSRWQKAVASLDDALRAGDWAGVGGQTLVQRAPDPEPEYDRAAMEEPLLGLLREAGRLARLGLAGRLERRAEAMERLAESYGEAFDRLIRRAGALRFEDVTRLLLGAAGEGGGRGPLAARPDLFYRLDGRTRHVLLDEFQDTSLAQWAALRPLTDALMGKEAPLGATASVVADPKQSIYGWRGAAPSVVDALAARYEVTRDTLATSWRSSQVVLDAVNAVFREIEKSPVVEDRELYQAAARDWARSFEPHTTEHEGRPGHVVLEAGPAMMDRKDLQPDLLRYAARRIRDLHRAMPGRTIGVLTRKNDAVGRLIFELRELGVPASEEGGTRLVDSAAVVSVVALLRLADHPGDRLARYHVARTPVGALMELTDETREADARRVAHRLRRRLLRDGYGPTLAWLRDALRPASDARDRLRLGQLAELGYRYDDVGPSLRVDDFVALAMVERVESPGEDPVRVMTVHGSKGLEFDVVVLPHLNPTLFGRGGSDGPLVRRPEGTGPATHVFPPMSKELRTLFEPVSEPLREAHAQARGAVVRDALSLLYVAMTRARYALHMIVPSDDGRASSARSPARLLRHALAGGDDELVDEGDVLYEDGEPGWSDGVPATGAGEASTGRRGEGIGAIELRRAPRRRLLPRRKPSDHGPPGDEDGAEMEEEAREAGGGMDLEALLGLKGRGGEGVHPFVRGTVVHAWMEEVEWMEDGLPGDDARRRILAAEAPEVAADRRDAFLGEWGGIVEAAVARAEVREALSRARAQEAHPGAELVVERELPFLLREGETLVEGIIDRLVLVRREGAVVAAEVLDYKTDRPDGAEDEALAERDAVYAPQLEAYRRAVVRLYGVEPGAVRLRLVYLVPGRVREVGRGRS